MNESEIVAAHPRGIPEGPAAIHFCPVPGCDDIWESEATCPHAALIPLDTGDPTGTFCEHAHHFQDPEPCAECWHGWTP